MTKLLGFHGHEAFMSFQNGLPLYIAIEIPLFLKSAYSDKASLTSQWQHILLFEMSSTLTSEIMVWQKMQVQISRYRTLFLSNSKCSSSIPCANSRLICFTSLYLGCTQTFSIKQQTFINNYIKEHESVQSKERMSNVIQHKTWHKQNSMPFSREKHIFNGHK